MDAPTDIAPAQALSARYHVDPEVFARARERIFTRSWHYVCHATNVPETGDYYAFTLLDQDLFVTRGRDGRLRCFYNVCQHRGHALVERTGRTRVFAHEHTAQEFCNWLVAVENYNECYHCGHVHKAFSDGMIDHVPRR